MLELYTDGACSGNPGPGGWGCVLLHEKTIRRMSGYEAATTNNRMELQAIVQGLSVLKKPCSIKVTTDSQYAKNAFTAGWLVGWQKNGWKTADNKPVKNQDIWLLLSELQRMHDLSWAWVKGHSGNRLNDMCDALARQAIVDRAGVDERIQDFV